MMLETLASWLGIKPAGLVAGFFGSLASMAFIKGPLYYRVMVFFGGLAASVFVTPGFVAYFDLARAENAMAFIFGLFGMSLADALVRTIRGVDFVTLNEQVRKWTGRG